MVIVFAGSRGIPYRSTYDRQEYHLELTALALREKGHKVEILTDPDYSSLSHYRDIPLHQVANIWEKLWTIRQISNLNIIHLTQMDWALVLGVKLFFPHIRIIVEQTISVMPERHLRWSRHWIDQYITSREDRQTYIKSLTKKPVHMVPRGLDIHLTKHNGHIKTWGLTRRKYLLFDTEPGYSENNLRLALIAGYKSLLDYPLVVMGRVDPQLKYMFPHVIFTGPLQGQQERELIANARFFIDTAPDKGDKHPLMLALGHATPVLSPRDSVHMNLVNRHGLHYSIENMSSLIHNMRFMEEAYSMLSQFAYDYAKTFRENHTLEGQINRYIYIYVNSFVRERKHQLQKSTASSIVIPIHS